MHDQVGKYVIVILWHQLFILVSKILYLTMRSVILIVLYFLISHIRAQNSNLFLKTNVPSDYNWSKYIYSSTDSKSTNIECGSQCMSDLNCELYTLHEVSKYCHLAKISAQSIGPTLSNVPKTSYGYLNLGNINIHENTLSVQNYFQISFMQT